MEMTMREWLVLIGAALVGLVALWLIAVAGEVYGLGIALFAAAVVFSLYWIRRVFDRIDAAGH